MSVMLMMLWATEWGVEAVPGHRLLGAGAASRSIEGLQHHDVEPGLGQIAGRHQAVVAGADDCHVPGSHRVSIAVGRGDPE